MSCFAGEFVFAQGRADPDVVSAMADRLPGRAADRDGAFLSPDGRCAIACRAAAVADQPLTSTDGRLTVACDGFVSDLKALRAELARHGADLREPGLAPAVVQLYAHGGPAIVESLCGPFAFALYDHRAGSLLLARDHLGQKPLCYATLSDRVVFASRPAAVLAHPNVRAELDPAAVTYYAIMGYIPAPASAWQGVTKLPPASRLTFSAGPAEPQRYWSPQPAAEAPSERDAADILRAHAAGFVEEQLATHGAVGALLSGGVDSSIVVALLARAVGPGVRTFTAVFDDPDYDERSHAAAVAKHCATNHTELPIAAPDRQTLERLLGLYDEPLADASALPTWLICREARKRVSAALCGDGGDEMFGGYDRYRALLAADAMSPPKYLAVRCAAALLSVLAPARERSGLRRFVRFAQVLPQPFAVQYFMYRRLFGPDDLPRLFTDDFAAGVNLDAPAQWFCELYEDGHFADEPTRAQHHDMMTYLPDDLCVKADVASTAAGLDLRAPFLDHRLAALGLALPLEAKLNSRRGKLILRKAFADMLPREILARPKRGFAVPLARWLRGPMLPILKETLLDPSLKRRGIFRPEALAGLLNDHLSGRADHSHRLWALLTLGRWLART